MQVQKDVQASQKLILRAEVTARGKTTITHTRQISASEVVIPVLEPIPVGERVEARLSFPGLSEPFVVVGEVTACHASAGAEDAAAVTVLIDGGDDSYRLRLERLLEPPNAKPSEAGPEYKVLVVDDNSLLLDMFEYGIHKYFRTRGGGVVVDVARDGAEAWELLEAVRHDLVIADYYLPVVDGAQLISQIRKDARVAATAVVAISVGGEEAREASTSAGADIFLDKPIVLRDLFATLDRLARQRRSE